MPEIGRFTRTGETFAGSVQTLTLFRRIIIVPAQPSDAENAPYYRVHASDGGEVESGPEIGAAWKRTGERAGDYLAVQIDDPALPQPIRANLFHHEHSHDWSLRWSRPRDHAEKE